MILHFGTWEPNITHVISGILQEGDVFVDVGANIGYHSLLGSKLVGSTGSVVAIEPVPDTFAMLLDNLRLNSCSNVRAVNVAVSDCPHKMPLYSLFGDFNCGAVTSVASRGGLSHLQC
jgi:FkbM family methyltransferase